MCWKCSYYQCGSLGAHVEAVRLFPRHPPPCCAASESRTGPVASGTVCSAPSASQTPRRTSSYTPPSPDNEEAE